MSLKADIFHYIPQSKYIPVYTQNFQRILHISKMKSPRTDNFTERMLKRASSGTISRKQKILAAINNQSDEFSPIVVNHQDDRATINSLSTAINQINLKINALEEKRDKTPSKIYPSLSPMLNTKTETRIVEDDIEIIAETPKLCRRTYRPNMESTRTSLSPLQSKTSQIESMISSIPVNGSSNVVSRTPYEVERFLEDSADDKLNNSNITYERENRESIDSHFNTSELMSQGNIPFYRKISWLFNRKRTDDCKPKDDTFSNGLTTSSTPDQSVKHSRTLSQRIKKKIRDAWMREKSSDGEELLSEAPRQQTLDAYHIEQMESIVKDMKLQQCIVQQASKALQVCRTSKEFLGSSEEIESERLLLLAEIRKRLLQRELNKLSDTSLKLATKPAETVDPAERADIIIEHIVLNLRESLHRPPVPGEIIEYFLIVIIEGTNVWGSSPAVLPVGPLYIEFTDFICNVENLKSDFKLVVEVYSLKLKYGMFFEHEEKYHITNPRSPRTTTCPSPSILLKKKEKKEKTSPPRLPPVEIICSSSFLKCGEVELSLHDLALSSPWALSGVPDESVLVGTIEFTLLCKPHLSFNLQGFLNYADEAGGFIIWNRRWCILKEHTLMFWNYPKEQGEKAPINCIDLANCVSEKIQLVDRQLCAKLRTISIGIIGVKGENDVDSILVECRERHTLRRYLLSFDTKIDLIEWTTSLNHMILALRGWNMSSLKKLPRSEMCSEL